MKPNILFVDDEPPVREMLSLYFRMKNCNITTAVTVKEAIEALNRVRCDAAILDINLAGENGLDLLAFIKSKYPKLPVVIFTALGSDEVLIQQAMSAGADRVMSKTLPIQDLFAEVFMHLPELGCLRSEG
jgi:DNA-binding response OmpR family regulator